MRPAFEGCHRRAPFKRNAGGKKLEIRLLGDVFFAGDDEIPPPPFPTEKIELYGWMSEEGEGVGQNGSG